MVAARGGCSTRRAARSPLRPPTPAPPIFFCSFPRRLGAKKRARGPAPGAPPPLSTHTPLSPLSLPPNTQITPWLAPAGHSPHLHAAALTLSTGLTFYLYLLVVFLDPGPVPAGYGTDGGGGAGAAECGEGGSVNGGGGHQAAGAAVVVEEVKRKGGGARVCTKCGGAPKPPRAHHCR